MRRTLFASMLLLVCVPAFAEVNIAWARAALAQNPNGQNAKEVTGPPDGLTTGISDNAFLYVVNFNFFKEAPNPATTYRDLGPQLFEMPDEEINRYDVIAFEINDNDTKGWESSMWFVTDQVRAAAGSLAGDTLNADHQCCVNSSPLKF